MSNCKERSILFTPAILAIAAIICGTAGTMYCETVEFRVDNGGNGGTSTEEGTLYAGVWSYRTKNIAQRGNQSFAVSSCRYYNYLSKELDFDYELDGKARTTMAFSLLAIFFGGLSIFAAILGSFMGRLSESRWKMLGNVFLFVCVLQALTLFMHTSSLCLDNPVLQLIETSNPDYYQYFDDECKWGPGYRLNVAAVVVWFLAGLSTYVFKLPKISRRDPVQRQTVTYHRNPDGTVVESNVSIVKGAAVEEQHPTSAEIDEEKK